MHNAIIKQKKEQKQAFGNFTDKQLAITARKAAEVRYGFHPNHDR